VEVDAVPAPISSGDGVRLDVTRGSEVIVIATATAIWVACVDIPIAVVSRTTTTGTTDGRDTSVARGSTWVTTTARRVIRKTGDVRRVVAITTVAVIGAWGATGTGTWEVLRSMVRGSVQSRSRSRSRCGSQCGSMDGGRWSGTRTAWPWGRPLNSGIFLRMERRCSGAIGGLLGFLFLEFASLGDERACSSDVVNCVTDCTGGAEVGDDRGVLSLWGISRVCPLGVSRLLGLTSSRLSHGIPCLFTELACLSSSSRDRTAKRPF
jgi:type IV secretory pathway VirB2 component (pilin)